MTLLKQISHVFRALIGVVAIAIAVGIFTFLFMSAEPAARSTELTPPRIVPAMRVAQVDTPIAFIGYGVARSMDAVDLAAEVPGRIVERPDSIEDGSVVDAGDVIVRIDPTTYQARVEALRAQLEQIQADLGVLEIEEASLAQRVRLTDEQAEAAQRELDRARDALSRGAGNESQVDTRLQSLRSTLVALETIREQEARIPSRRAGLNAQLASRRGDLRAAEADLDRATVRSPISGVVQTVSVEAGDYARAGDPIARVVNTRRLEIPVRLPVSSAGIVRVGDPAEIRPDGSDLDGFAGFISRIAPEADAGRRTLTVFVEVDLDSADDAQRGGGSPLKPGRFVEARIVSDQTEPRIIVPRRVVRDERAFVGEPVTVEAARDGDAALDRVDFGAAKNLLRVREVEVRVERYIDAAFPDLDPIETQWAVLSPDAATMGRGLEPGHLILLGDLQRLRVGMVVDGGVQQTQPMQAGGES